MISLSRAARVPDEGASPDALLSGSVCMSSPAGPGREGAGLGRAVGDGVVLALRHRCISGWRRVAGAVVLAQH